MQKTPSPPRNKTISAITRDARKNNSEEWTDFCTRQYRCQAESFSSAGFHSAHCKTLRTTRKNLRRGHPLSSTQRFQKVNESMKSELFWRDASILQLLTGLRSKRLGWIEEAAPPEGLIRKRSGFPFPERKQRRCCHSSIFGIENHNHSRRAG